tara:strand:+ start:39 stop:1019 length:981 start_codon:yes stop_codon:yes gene_type:complete
MAEVSGLDMVREIIGQINNLRRLVTINGKKFKWDGKKYVRAVDGKTFTKKELVSFVKDEKFTAPKTPKATKGELKVDGKTVYKKRDVIGDLKSKAKGLKSNALKIGKQGLNKGNQVLQNAKLRINPNPSEVTRRASSVNKRIGKGGVAATIIDALLDKTRFADRTANFMTNTMFGQNMNLAERDASKNVNLAALKSGKFREDLNTARNLNKVTQGIKNPEQTGGVIGRTRQDPYLDRSQPTTPTKTETPKSEVKKPKVQKEVDKKPKEQLKAKTVVKKEKKKEALKVNKQLERRKKAIKRAYGNISDKRLNQLLSRAVTQRELEES